MLELLDWLFKEFRRTAIGFGERDGLPMSINVLYKLKSKPKISNFTLSTTGIDSKLTHQRLAGPEARKRHSLRLARHRFGRRRGKISMPLNLALFT